MTNTKDLLSHFVTVRSNGTCVRNVKHLEYYKNSLKRYHDYLANKDNYSANIAGMRWPRQVEKDERFWVAACLMTVYYDANREKQLTSLLEKTYGLTPPIPGINTWSQCLTGNLHLFFEVSLPSPETYKSWLKANINSRQFIPFILECAGGKQHLEGPTNVDAMLINADNGFALVIEAKVLSDI